MLQSNTLNDHQARDNEAHTLGAGLLLLTTTTTTTTSGSDKYRRIWRRSIGVGILVSVMKRPLYGQDSPQPSPSSIPYSPCPQEQPEHVIQVIPSADEDQEKETDEDREKVVRIMREKNLPSLLKLGGLDWVARVLGSNLEVIIYIYIYKSRVFFFLE
jgi:hypothetical protein